MLILSTIPAALLVQSIISWMNQLLGKDCTHFFAQNTASLKTELDGFMYVRPVVINSFVTLSGVLIDGT